MTKRILVIGDSIIDRHWYCTPKGVSPEAPILNWDVDQIISRPGGAANVAHNLNTLIKLTKEDVEILFVSIISPEFISCIPAGFPIQGLVISAERKQSIKNRIIFYSPHQQITRFDQDVSIIPTEEELSDIKRYISSKQFDIGLISDYAHGGINREVLELVRKVCNLVIVDPKGDDLYKYQGLVDAITPNLKEFDELTDKKDDCLTRKLFILSSLIGNNGPPIKIILKRGEHGCLFWNQSSTELEPYRSERTVIDPTGAGDTFIAALAFYLAKDKDWISSVKEANRLAGISTTFPHCWIPERRFLNV